MNSWVMQRSARRRTESRGRISSLVVAAQRGALRLQRAEEGLIPQSTRAANSCTCSLEHRPQSEDIQLPIVIQIRQVQRRVQGVRLVDQLQILPYHDARQLVAALQAVPLEGIACSLIQVTRRASLDHVVHRLRSAAALGDDVIPLEGLGG